MNIINVNEYRFGAELSFDELNELGISCKELDYSNIETRRVLWSVLHEARSYGIDVSLSEKLLIEAEELANGGVLLFFTVLNNSGQEPYQIARRQKNQKLPIMLTTENLSELISACAALPASTQSTLYRQNKSYRLFCFVAPDEKNYISGVLAEYGTVKSSFCSAKLASCEETWTSLAENNAVSLLAGLK